MHIVDCIFVAAAAAAAATIAVPVAASVNVTIAAAIYILSPFYANTFVMSSNFSFVKYI